MKKLAFSCLFSLLLIFSGAAWSKDTGLYIGASGGVSEVNVAFGAFDDDGEDFDDDDGDIVLSTCF